MTVGVAKGAVRGTLVELQQRDHQKLRRKCVGIEELLKCQGERAAAGSQRGSGAGAGEYTRR